MFIRLATHGEKGNPPKVIFSELTEKFFGQTNKTEVIEKIKCRTFINVDIIRRNPLKIVK